MALLKICALLVMLQLASTRRTEAKLDSIGNGASRKWDVPTGGAWEPPPSWATGTACTCAVCRWPNSIRIGEWDNKGVCHWSRQHQYFWCGVEHGCPCANKGWGLSWTKCGAGSAHLSQLVERVQTADWWRKYQSRHGTDPCEDFKDLGKESQVVTDLGDDLKYPNLGGAEYKAELQGLSPLVEACKVHEDSSRVLEASQADQGTLDKMKAFLEEHPNTEAEKGVRALAVETCFKAIRYGSAYGPCGYASDGKLKWPTNLDANSELAELCHDRIDRINELHSFLSAARPTKALVASMWEKLSRSQKAGLESNGFRNQRSSWGCSYGMEKAVEWGSQLGKL